MTKRETRDRGRAATQKRAAPPVVEEVKRPAPRAPTPPVQVRALSADEAEQARRIKLATIGGGVFTVLVAMIYGGLEFGPPAVVLGLMGLALIGVIALFWNSIRTLIGETRLTGEDAFAIGAPRVEEEQKRAMLRALRDLQFEHAVGKISDEDYAVLSDRYRQEAKKLLRQIDEATAEQRARAEALVGGRLRSIGIAPDPIAPLPSPTAPTASKTVETPRSAPEEGPAFTKNPEPEFVSPKLAPPPTLDEEDEEDEEDDEEDEEDEEAAAPVKRGKDA